jgi:phosphoglycerate-specific signal transduction histidine kinase
VAESEHSPDLRSLEADLIARFADDVAHEIRNPLNALVINLEVLRRRVAAGDREAALARIEVLEHEVRRTHDTVERLVQLLRRRKSAEGTTELAAALDETLPLISLRARAMRAGFQGPTLVSGRTSLARDRLRFVLLETAMAALDRIVSDGHLSCIAGPDAGEGSIIWQATPVQDTSLPELRLTHAILDEAGGTVAAYPGTGAHFEIRISLPIVA